MISVCMATYNGERYIKEQVDSILPQLSADDELVVSDDYSTDNTVSILKSYNDTRIKIFENKRIKTGIKPIRLVTSNFENALLHCKGDIIFLADQDDVWSSDKISKMTHYLIDEGYDYVESDCYVTDENLTIIRESIRKNIKFDKWKSLFGTAYYQGSLCAFKRKILSDALPFPKKLQSHDRWLGYIAAFKYRVLLPTPDYLVYYRRHGDSTIVNSKQRNIVSRAFERIRYSYYLIMRLLFKV